MKTLNYFKYLLFVLFSATLMFSCSDDESSDQALNTKDGEIELRNSDEWNSDIDADCFVKLCVDITPSSAPYNFTDIFTIDIPGVGTWSISNNIVTLPNGATTNVINNQYCFSVPINAVASAVFEFHGYGGVAVSGTWNGTTTCDLFAAEWPGTFKAPLNAAEEIELTCDPPCEEPPTCFVETCIVFTEGDVTDNYTLLLPTQGSVTIANGMVNINTNTTQQTFPLPADGTVCLPLPVFDPVTATVIYNGTGSAVITGTWDNGATCTIFSVGECTNTFIHLTEEITISCDPPCPAPLCEVEACITFIEGDVTDNYTLILPTVGSVTILNGNVTLPNGCEFPLPADGTFCTTLPIFAPTTATVIYNGTGSVEINVTYDNGVTCPVFSAGVNSELDLHITEEVTLDCDPVCPVLPDCYVNVCLDYDDTGSNLFRVTVPGVGIIQFNNGQIQTPNGTFPNPGGQFCIDLPVFNGGSTAELFYFQVGTATAGSAEVTFTYPDLGECVVFSANMTKKMDVTLTCDGDCDPEPEFCEIEICANFSPATDDDVYQVTLASGDMITIQGGVITLPGGQTLPYNGYQFCTTIMIEVGTTETAGLTFKGSGEVFTTVNYLDSGGFCTIFSAGQGIWKPVKKGQKISLGCDPIC